MRRQRVRAQAVVEFTTASIVFIMLAFGLVQILRWSQNILSEKADKHDECMQSSDVSSECLGALPATRLEATMD